MNFMMLPLCTIVTEGSLLSTAHCMALRTSRLVPVTEIGFTPIPLSGRIWRPGLLLDELDDGLGHLASALEVMPRVHVLGVLAEDHEVHVLGVLVGSGHALEVAHRPHARVEVHGLAQARR